MYEFIKDVLYFSKQFLFCRLCALPAHGIQIKTIFKNISHKPEQNCIKFVYEFGINKYIFICARQAYVKCFRGNVCVWHHHRHACVVHWKILQNKQNKKNCYILIVHSEMQPEKTSVFLAESNLQGWWRLLAHNCISHLVMLLL